MTKEEKRARELIANETLSDLLDEWEFTTNANDPYIATIRGWLMDEFEERNPKAFDKWLDESARDEELRNYF